MIKDGKYRFTLQFGMDTIEEQQAGQLLEKLGSKKSPVVIAALNEYIGNHPEVHDGTVRVQFHRDSSSQQLLEETIRRLIEERLGKTCQMPIQAHCTEPDTTKQVSNDILDMLSDLDMFS